MASERAGLFADAETLEHAIEIMRARTTRSTLMFDILLRIMESQVIKMRQEARATPDDT